MITMRMRRIIEHRFLLFGGDLSMENIGGVHLVDLGIGSLIERGAVDSTIVYSRYT